MPPAESFKQKEDYGTCTHIYYFLSRMNNLFIYKSIYYCQVINIIKVLFSFGFV